MSHTTLASLNLKTGNMWFESLHTALTYIQYSPQKQESLFLSARLESLFGKLKKCFLNPSCDILCDFSQLVEVSATITNRELRHRIADQLSLSSPEGYGLYTKVSQKVCLGDICVQLLPLVLLAQRIARIFRNIYTIVLSF